MTYSHRTYRRWLRRLALCVAVAAIAAPAAQGVGFPSLPGLPAGTVGSVAVEPASEQEYGFLLRKNRLAEPSIYQTSVTTLPTLTELEQFRFDGRVSDPPRPDERPLHGPGVVRPDSPPAGPATVDGPIAAPGAPWYVAPEGMPYSIDAPRSGPGSITTPQTGPTPILTPAAEPGVDWRLIGIGAGAGVALLLAGLAALVALRRRGTLAGA